MNSMSVAPSVRTPGASRDGRRCTSSPGRARDARGDLRSRSASHGWFGQRRGRAVQIGIAHERVAGQILRQQRDAPVHARHHLLADFLESVGAVEQNGDVVARFEEHFAGQQRHAHFGEARHVGVEDAAEAEALIGPRDDDAVDVEELRIVLAEPQEVRTAVVGVFAQRDQEAGDVAVDQRDAEIGGLLRSVR